MTSYSISWQPSVYDDASWCSKLLVFAPLVRPATVVWCAMFAEVDKRSNFYIIKFCMPKIAQSTNLLFTPNPHVYQLISLYVLQTTNILASLNISICMANHQTCAALLLIKSKITGEKPTEKNLNFQFSSSENVI